MEQTPATNFNSPDRRVSNFKLPERCVSYGNCIIALNHAQQLSLSKNSDMSNSFHNKSDISKESSYISGQGSARRLIVKASHHNPIIVPNVDLQYNSIDLLFSTTELEANFLFNQLKIEELCAAFYVTLSLISSILLNEIKEFENNFANNACLVIISVSNFLFSSNVTSHQFFPSSVPSIRNQSLKQRIIQLCCRFELLFEEQLF